jgi:hypothetical protein
MREDFVPQNVPMKEGEEVYITNLKGLYFVRAFFITVRC